MTTQLPIQTFQSGRMSATIWKQSGRNGEFYTVSLSRSYKTEEGTWQNTTSFRVSDLPHIQTVSRRADDYIAGLPSEQVPDEQDAVS